MKKQGKLSQLPQNTVKEVAKRTNLSEPLVSTVLRGVTQSKHKPIIFKTAAEYVREYKAAIKEAETALLEAINA